MPLQQQSTIFIKEGKNFKFRIIQCYSHSNINVYSSDSDSIDSDEENFTENIPSIPKEFHIEVCNKEWVVDVDPKK